MQRTALQSKLQAIIEPLAQAQGLELWGLDIPAGSGRGVLRVYVESENGVSIDDCAALSRNLSVVLDVEDPLPGSYVLEVSSPGLERPFFTPRQMAAFTGSPVAVSLLEPIDGRRKWRGVLKGVEGETVRLESDGEERTFDWNSIKRAHLVYKG